MFIENLKYEDFDGNEIEGEFRFHLSKAELKELELETAGGFRSYLERIVKAKDGVEIAKTFKKILLMSYGVVSEDRTRFIKSPELTKAFTETNAYDIMYNRLSEDDKYAAAFINGVLPKELTQDHKAAETK